jgi:hypothetical protein
MDRTTEQLKRAEAYARAENPRRAWQAFSELMLTDISSEHWDMLRETRTVLMIATPEDLDSFNRDGLLVGRMITAYALADGSYRDELERSARDLEAYHVSYKGLVDAMKQTAANIAAVTA